MLVPLEKPGTPEELVHFGIKGMKWGVRKREESSGRNSRSKPISPKKEARAKKHDEKARTAQAEIDKILANPARFGYFRNQQNLQVSDLSLYKERHEKAAEDIRAGRLTDTQKKILIGAGVTAGVLAAYGTYKFIDSGMARQLMNKRVPFKRNSLLSRKMTPDQIMKDVVSPINRDFGKEMGTRMNCRRCTFAYEMRRRGLDVKSTRTLTGTGQFPGSLQRAKDPYSRIDTGKLATQYRLMKEKGDGPFTKLLTEKGLGDDFIISNPNLRMLNIKTSGAEATSTSKSVFDHLKTYGNGARGELGVKWKAGGAHSMAWEVIDGVPHIFDTQSGKEYTRSTFKELASNIETASSTRLDNVNLNTAFLRRWVQNA